MSFTTRNLAETQGTTQPPSPKVGDQHFDTVTGVTYRCMVADAWEAVSMPKAYGSLSEKNPSGTVIAIATGGTFVKWVSSVAGPSNLTTPSVANDNIVIDAGGGGVYLIAFQVSYLGNANEVYHWGVFVEGAEVDAIGSERKITANDQGSQSGVGFMALSATDVVDLRVTSTTNTETATVEHVQLAIMRVGI